MNTKIPPYPKKKTCWCKAKGIGSEPEWEWQEWEDQPGAYMCLGCGQLIDTLDRNKIQNPEDKPRKGYW